MNPIVIWRVKNGYLVTNDDGWMTNDDIKNCHVFTNLDDVAKHITAQRDDRPPNTKPKVSKVRVQPGHDNTSRRQLSPK